MKMNKIVLFFVIIMLFTPLVNAANFGEDEDYLGQVIDDYENDDNVDGAVNIINNSTLDCMELNLTSGLLTENYTTYTEHDVGADRIIFDDYWVEHDSYRNEITYLYKEFTSKTFFEFETEFDVYISYEEQYAVGIPFMLSNFTGDERQHIDNSWGMLAFRFYRSTPPQDRRVMIIIRNSTGGFVDAEINYPIGQWLYITARQNSTHYAAWVYTDEAKTTLWTYFEIRHDPEYYDIMYGCNGYRTAAAANHIIYNVTKLRIFSGEFYEEDGYYYADDILDGDPALTYLYNISIPENTNATIEFSTDNETWVDHNNVAGYDLLIAGYESLDLRDIYNETVYRRVNMSSNGVYTPRLYQDRFVTVTSIIISGGGINSSTLIIVIFLSIIAISLVYGVK